MKRRRFSHTNPTALLRLGGYAVRLPRSSRFSRAQLHHRRGRRAESRRLREAKNSFEQKRSLNCRTLHITNVHEARLICAFVPVFYGYKLMLSQCNTAWIGLIYFMIIRRFRFAPGTSPVGSACVPAVANISYCDTPPIPARIHLDQRWKRILL